MKKKVLVMGAVDMGTDDFAWLSVWAVNIGTSLGEETPYKIASWKSRHRSTPPLILESCAHCESLFISPEGVSWKWEL